MSFYLMSQDEPILISVPEVPTDDEIQRVSFANAILQIKLFIALHSY